MLVLTAMEGGNTGNAGAVFQCTSMTVKILIKSSLKNQIMGIFRRIHP